MLANLAVELHRAGPIRLERQNAEGVMFREAIHDRRPRDYSCGTAHRRK